MIVQPYAFKGDDFDSVYVLARKFLQMLRVDAGVSVTLPDGFRSVTKYYPDYGQTMTVIEVFPDISVDEQIEMIERVYQVACNSPDPAPADPVFGAYNLINAVQFKPGEGVYLDANTDGWFLTDRRDQGRVFNGVSSYDVYGRVKQALTQMGVYPVPAPEAEEKPVTVPVPSGDDFDPFLDSDDLP